MLFVQALGFALHLSKRICRAVVLRHPEKLVFVEVTEMQIAKLSEGKVFLSRLDEADTLVLGVNRQCSSLDVASAFRSDRRDCICWTQSQGETNNSAPSELHLALKTSMMHVCDS